MVHMKPFASKNGQYSRHYVLLQSLETFYESLFSENEPLHEISNNVVCATSKGSDQPAHMRSLIRAFACRLNMLRVLSY